jgi:hypothetical protein
MKNRTPGAQLGQPSHLLAPGLDRFRFLRGDVVVRSPDHVDQGSAAMWAELHEDGDPADLTALIVEACRIKDRLDLLDASLGLDGILRLVEKDDRIVEVRVDNALAEARQQAGRLQTLLNDIRNRREGVGGDEDDGLADL